MLRFMAIRYSQIRWRAADIAARVCLRMQRQLARFYTWRDLARHELVEAMVGRRIVDAIPLNAKGDRLRVALTADDGSSITVEIRAG